MSEVKFKKTPVRIADYYDHILAELRKGITITATTPDGTHANPMAISWGMLGVQWQKDVFITFVRKGRHTHNLLTANPEFTVNIPLQRDKATGKIIALTGTKSGRDTDKVSELDITLVPGESITAPGIAELPLTLECRVVYAQPQDLSLLAEEHLKHYPQDVPGTFHGGNQDPHTAFYGEIVGAYVIEKE